MAKSIIQADKEKCFICGMRGNFDTLDEHHVFFGINRKNSEKYGLKVYLHHNKCHIFGKYAVHQNAEVCRALQAKIQEIAMEHFGWTEDDFRRIFGKSYL
jgi:hypothetical protein